MISNDVEIKCISAKETRPLRKLILRPHQQEEDLVYPGDNDEMTIHIGLFYENKLVGIASLYNEPMKDSKEMNSWRLRGMATTEEVRGMGFGKELMNVCMEHIKSKSGKIFWCNARTTAEKFYEKFGMKRVGDVFYPEGLGEHVVMVLRIAY